ncbi:MULTISPECIES: hypothetical protein [Rhodopseudomonas]|uniref:hypothetical protein n=1 Tax=Rhodopseudomonas TaxID=1073 RepID=UPI0006964F89|nr:MULTISPECIES: hypothetical protein [Rhodopseudomonas]MDF3808705.1 hypothetical protein [Rhodopseudomonas sp. BAL398]WOK19773.1 hypothetical protein RBJ75_09760 [Rhodopseudomonas sp. BAL398]
MMIKQLLACAILSTALSQAAFAGPGPSADNTTTKSTNKMSSNQNAQDARSLPQEIRSKLQKAGYTDVKVVPRSFTVQAKDSDGDPVLMMIGPHSMTMISAMNTDQNSATTGSAMSPGKSSSGNSAASGNSSDNK